ncbi:hypothetical protein CHUAL_013859 [Chamberlinius hualienensis]
MESHDGSIFTVVIVTSKNDEENGFKSQRGEPYDFVSRIFAPWNGVDEDPVTPTAHAVLACDIGSGRSAYGNVKHDEVSLLPAALTAPKAATLLQPSSDNLFDHAVDSISSSTALFSFKTNYNDQKQEPQKMAKFLRRSFKKKKGQDHEDMEVHLVRYKPDAIDALCRSTKFSRKEIQLMYRGFKQRCPNGIVSESMFKDIYSQFFPQGDSSQYAHYVFNTFDRHRAGSINFKEFVMALSLLSRGSLQEKLQWAFSLYDINGDGFITRDEMSDIVSSIYKLLGRYTDPAVDKHTARDHVERVFQKLDVNKDGVVTLDEFMEKCLGQDEDITKSLSLLDTVLFEV